MPLLIIKNYLIKFVLDCIYYYLIYYIITQWRSLPKNKTKTRKQTNKVINLAHGFKVAYISNCIKQLLAIERPEYSSAGSQTSNI
jgi:hypothetical protein